ncbi:MtrAB system accessory lipoprotein LpqB [Tomitella biformata]|uniref:MtrAB system accessory lipoprotein LpqB n=1 Tax=Tomitella biformata TaxID=630403 RepID=UPI0004BA4745|nr:MtrAB system accessory lipoprotein LpqB [Tomitella biformata]
MRISAGKSTFGALLTLVLVGVLLLTGCAALPSTSAPQAIGVVQRDAGLADVPTPTSGKEPDLLLRDFVKASSEPGGRHSAARKYLTGSAAVRWDDTVSISIVEKIDVFFDSRTADSATLLVRAAKVGDLDDQGVFKAEEGTLETRVTMIRENNEWRIDQLPDGVIVDRSQFLNAYHEVALYFLNRQGTVVVADPRWLSLRTDELAAQLIDMLITGPKAPLAEAVSNKLGSDVHLRSTLTKLDGRDSDVGIGVGGVKMDFQGIGSLGQANRRLLAAQVIWTLSSAGIAGPYEILADGAPLDATHPEPLTTEDVAVFSSDTESHSAGLLAITDGTLVSVVESGAIPVPGALGQPSDLISASLSRGGDEVAGVRIADVPGERLLELVVGPFGGDAVPVASGGAITRPTWSVGDNSVWAAIGGDKVVRAAKGSDGRWFSAPVDIREITELGGPITEMRISGDGVRVALIVGGRVFIAYSTPLDDGSYRLSAPRAIGFSLGSSLISLDWNGSQNLGVLRSGADNPLAQLSYDGFFVRPMTNRNLSPPLRAIDMTASEAYVVDSRGVMRLSIPGTADEQYWREVPGLMGNGAVPVTQG